MNADSEQLRVVYEGAVKQNPSDIEAVQYLAVWHLERLILFRLQIPIAFLENNFNIYARTLPDIVSNKLGNILAT